MRNLYLGGLMAVMLWGGVGLSRAADAVIDITKEAFPAPIPISISGFNAEIVEVLKTDLMLMGFEDVPASRAQYLVTGQVTSRVEGRLLERINNTQIVGKAYGGASIRSQAHAFANEIAEKLNRGPGIALSEIAFKTETGGGNSEIYVADYDGFNARAVTRDSSLVVAPSWGADRTLFYTSYKLGTPSVFSHNLGTGARGTVARYPGSNISPAVSPDGRRVAMILSKGGDPDLYVANADGTGLTRLTKTRGEESSPCWSPDGREICYVSKSSGVNQIYRIPVSGGTRKRVTTAGVVNPTEPDWSPDGKWIVFTSLMRDFNICIVPAEGGQAKVITVGEDPTWAANSRAVVFCRGRDHEKHLSLLDVPTGRVKDVRRIQRSNSQPSWRR